MIIYRYLPCRLDSQTFILLGENGFPQKEASIISGQGSVETLGFYQKYDFGVVCVTMEANSPTLVIAGSKYPFADPSWSCAVGEAQGKWVFRLTDGDGSVRSLPFRPKKPVSWDTYSDAEDDALIWIANVREDKDRHRDLIEHWRNVARSS